MCCNGGLEEHCFPRIQNLLSHIEETIICLESREKEKKKCITSIDICTEDKMYYIMVQTIDITLKNIGITTIHT